MFRVRRPVTFNNEGHAASKTGSRMESLNILESPSLCRTNDQTCGACCWGVNVGREELQIRLEHHRILYERFADRLPSRWEMLLHEIKARRGINLVWAVLFRIPIFGRRFRQKIAAKLTCAFMGFDSPDQKKVGCMLHPTRYNNVDVRNTGAFQLLPGVSCGSATYVCTACQRYNGMSTLHRDVFDSCVADTDWFEYTQTVRSFSCSAVIASNKKPSDRDAA